MTSAVASLDFAILPITIQNLGSDTRCSGMRIGAEVSYSGVDMQAAVRSNSHQAIESIAAGRVIGLTDRHADHTLLPSRWPLVASFFFPAEHLSSAIQCFRQVCARYISLGAAIPRIRLRRIDGSNL